MPIKKTGALLEQKINQRDKNNIINKNMRRYSIFLDIMEMQIKSKMRHTCTTIRIIQKFFKKY